MALRSQFIRGFSRLLGLADLLALAVWAIVAILWAVSIYHGQAQQLWPYTRISTDDATLFLAFICLGAPLFSFVFRLPVNAARLVAAGFMKMENEGVPEGDWLLFRMFAFLVISAVPYLSKLSAWAITLTVFSFIDYGQATDSFSNEQTSYWLLWSIGWFNGNLFYLSVAAHGLVIISAISIRFAIFSLLGLHVQGWLESRYIQVLGEARAKAVDDYTKTIAEQEGIIPLLSSILGRNKSKQSNVLSKHGGTHPHQV